VSVVSPAEGEGGGDGGEDERGEGRDKVSKVPVLVDVGQTVYFVNVSIGTPRQVRAQEWREDTRRRGMREGGVEGQGWRKQAGGRDRMSIDVPVFSFSPV
jgi:hypothetical protein